MHWFGLQAFQFSVSHVIQRNRPYISMRVICILLFFTRLNSWWLKTLFEETAVFGLLHFLTWCQKWETKNSPLEQIFKKNIDKTPSRFQRLLLRRLRLDVHVKEGRSIPVADALSRVCHRKVGRNVGHVTEGSTSQRNIHFMSTPST